MHPKLAALISGYGSRFLGLEKLLNHKLSPDEESRLNAPLPGLGRYYKSVSFLENVTSAKCVGLLRFWVMKKYFFALADRMNKYDGKYAHQKIVSSVSDLSSEDFQFIQGLGATALEVRQAELLERVSEHDTAAAGDLLKILIAYFRPDLAKVMDGIHFAGTSEDVMGNVFGIITRMLAHGYFMGGLADFCLTFINFAKYCEQEGELILPGLTHIQVAEPTFLSRRFAVPLRGIQQILLDMMTPHMDFKPFSGKLGGALGNLTTHFAAYPDINWEIFARNFVEGLGLYYEPLAHQSVSFVRESQQFKSIAGILDEICKLVSDFINMVSCPGQLMVKIKQEGAKGSSVLPGKVNLWAMEGALRTFRWAKKDLLFLAEELTNFPFEGDMGRSYLMRNIGLPFMHIFIGFDRVLSELAKCHPNFRKINMFLDEYPGMAGSSLQTILKRAGIEGDAYRKIQTISINPDDSYANQQEFRANLEVMMQELDLPPELRDELLSCLDFASLIKPSARITSREVERMEIFYQIIKDKSERHKRHEALLTA